MEARIKIFDVVETMRDICYTDTATKEEMILPAGSDGAVVEIYKGGEAYEVEFVRNDGYTDALLTIQSDNIRLVETINAQTTPSEWYSTKEAANILGISNIRLSQLINGRKVTRKKTRGANAATEWVEKPALVAGEDFRRFIQNGRLKIYYRKSAIEELKKKYSERRRKAQNYAASARTATTKSQGA